MVTELPTGLDHFRTTDVFDADTVPRALLRAHKIAAGVWGRLVVHAGSITFVFEDDPDSTQLVAAGGSVLIPPAKPHHVELGDGGRFAVEFHRPPT